MNKKFLSLYYYVKSNTRYVIFFTLFFSLLALVMSFVVNPVYNTVSRVVVSGQGMSSLASLSSQLPFGLDLGGGAITDELEIINSTDLKKVVFQESDAKIKWGKVDETIRHSIVFDSIPLQFGPKKIKIEVTSNNSFNVYLSKKLKDRMSFPFKEYEQCGSGKSGELVNVKNEFNFLITSNNLEVGEKYVFEIGYKFPKQVYSTLFDRISFFNGPTLSIIDILTSGGDPIKVVELNLSFFEKYIESRYKNINENSSEIISIMDKKIEFTKLKIDSLAQVQKELSMQYKIISIADEIPGLYAMYTSFYQAKSQIEVTNKITKKNAPYDNISLETQKTQLAYLNDEIVKLTNDLYNKYPTAAVDFAKIEYQITGETSILTTLVSKREAAKMSEILEIGNRKLFEKPIYPFSRTKPERFKSLIKFFMFGMFAGILYVLFLRYHRREVCNFFDFNIGIGFTIKKDASSDSQISYIKKNISPLIDENVLCCFYKDSVNSFATLLSKTVGAIEIKENVMNQIKFTKKRSVAVICTYGEVAKSDINKLDDIFEERIIWIIRDVELNDNEYYYDKFSDSFFKEQV